MVLHFIVIDKIEIKEATEQMNHEDRGNMKVVKQSNNKKTTNKNFCLTNVSHVMFKEIFIEIEFLMY